MNLKSSKSYLGGYECEAKHLVMAGHAPSSSRVYSMNGICGAVERPGSRQVRLAKPLRKGRRGPRFVVSWDGCLALFRVLVTCPLWWSRNQETASTVACAFTLVDHQQHETGSRQPVCAR
jgi:hypothetical protein